MSFHKGKFKDVLFKGFESLPDDSHQEISNLVEKIFITSLWDEKKACQRDLNIALAALQRALALAIVNFFDEKEKERISEIAADALIRTCHVLQPMGCSR